MKIGQKAFSLFPVNESVEARGANRSLCDDLAWAITSANGMWSPEIMVIRFGVQRADSDGLQLLQSATHIGTLRQKVS